MSRKPIPASVVDMLFGPVREDLREFGAAWGSNPALSTIAETDQIQAATQQVKSYLDTLDKVAGRHERIALWSRAHAEYQYGVILVLYERLYRTGKFCSHITPGPMPVVITTGIPQAFCGPCYMDYLNEIKGTDEDGRCDGCREVTHKGFDLTTSKGALVLQIWLCDDCWAWARDQMKALQAEVEIKQQQEITQRRAERIERERIERERPRTEPPPIITIKKEPDPVMLIAWQLIRETDDHDEKRTAWLLLRQAALSAGDEDTARLARLELRKLR